jgi:Domain of unknown function (DUF3846)
MKQIMVGKLTTEGTLVFEKINNDLKSKQDFVGGYIEHLQITKNIGIILNEEGKLDQLEPSLMLTNKEGEVLDYIAGNCLFVGLEDMNPEFVSLTSDDKYYLTRKLQRIRLYKTDTGEYVNTIHSYIWG